MAHVPKCNCGTATNAEAGSNKSNSSFPSQCCMKQRLWWMWYSRTFSDICFVVGSEPHTQEIHAHKAILSSGSDVFKTMFSEKWSSESKSTEKIPDVDPTAFSTVLRFLYTDDATLTADSVMQILYAAKKYSVLALENRCIDFLEKELCPENVFTILVQARLFDEPKLVKACLEVIDKKPVDAFASDNFTNISQDELCQILERDTLRIREIDLFKSVLRWASAECKRKKLKVNAENQKLVLKRAVYLIRYPLMLQKDFIDKVVPSGYLSSDELVDMFLYFGGSLKDSFSFNSSPRTLAQPFVINRFQRINEQEWHFGGSWDSICFQFNRSVKLCGFGLYSAKSREPASYNIDMQVKHQASSKTIYQKDNLKYETDGSSKTYQILLENSVKLKANTKYSAHFKIQGQQTFAGLKGLTTVATSSSQHGEELEVCFQTFGDRSFPFNGTDWNRGQIPEILVEF